MTSRRHPVALADDRGAGAVLALAIVVAIVVVGLGAVALAGALGQRQRLIGASDLAALAAADAASGAVAGDPCAIARRLAEAADARLASCRIDGLTVEVVLVSSADGFPITARSRAGPPP